MKYYLFLIVLFSQSFFSFSQSEIILSEIMKGKDFIGYWPENHFWHVKGEKIIFQWNPDFKTEASWYEHSLLTNKTLQVDEQDEYSTLAYDRSQADYNDQYSVVNGHLIRYDKKLKSFQKLYSTTDRLRNIQRLENPNKVAFQIGNNLFTYNRENGSFLQITDFKLEDEKKEIKESTYLNSAEEELFNFIKEEAEEKKTKVKSDRWNLNTHYLGKNNLVFLSLSPDEKMVYLGISTKTTTTNTIYSSYINEDGATKSNTARPKVGEAESEMKIFQFRLKDNKIELINLKSLSDYQRKPEYFKSYGDSNLFYFSDRLVYIHAPKFSNKSTPLFDIRSLDNKDRWIAAFDTQNNTLVEIDHQHDEAWIGGPGIEPWDVVPGTLNWINSSDFYFQSEESGFSQLYTYSFSTKSKTQLTKGNFEIRDAQLSTDKNSIYFVANKTHPGNRSFYQIDIKTKEWKTLWEQKGGIQPELSPDEKTIAALISTTNNPWELFTIQNKKATQITKSTTEAFKSISIADPKIISFKGQDNTDVFARVYSPTISSNKAAVIFVHGAGYLQNAHEYWSGYYREFLFHQLLINQGYTVLDIDYRASEGYGRDYRTAIYQHMGGMDLNDQLSGKNFLLQNLGIDSNKIGIYGGSYGGFITLMALLTKPNEFACGAALRSVTDWAHYNHEYTSNILNYPTTDPDAYRRSSPIYFAENLQKPLLMLHGMVDDNVQFQDVVRLSQRFIELGKTNWDLAIYPVEAHGFVKSYSWTDEYRRILELFNENLLDK